MLMTVSPCHKQQKARYLLLLTFFSEFANLPSSLLMTPIVMQTGTHYKAKWLSLITEFDRVAQDTEFNGLKVLQGKALTTNLHVGANRNENFFMVMRSLLVRLTFIAMRLALK